MQGGLVLIFLPSHKAPSIHGTSPPMVRGEEKEGEKEGEHSIISMGAVVV